MDAMSGGIYDLTTGPTTEEAIRSLEESHRRLATAVAAADALAAALPKCRCGDVATWSMPSTPDMETGHREDAEMACDQHVHRQGCGRVGCCDPTELPWAEPVRAFTRIRKEMANGR